MNINNKLPFQNITLYIKDEIYKLPQKKLHSKQVHCGLVNAQC